MKSFKFSTNENFNTSLDLKLMLSVLRNKKIFYVNTSKQKTHHEVRKTRTLDQKVSSRREFVCLEER